MDKRKSIKRSVWIRTAAALASVLLFSFVTTANILRIQGVQNTNTQAASLLQRAQGAETYVLSTESCAICAECAYPDGPCRCPEKMFPCVESHGILITETAERYGISFQAGGNVVTWFSLILYR